MTQKYGIWSIATQKFLVLKMSGNNTPEITFTGTGDEDGTGDKGSCILEKKTVSSQSLNGYNLEFNHKGKNYALHKDRDGNITAKEVGGTCDPLLSKIVFVPSYHNVGPLKAVNVSDSPTNCLTADISKGNLFFEGSDANKPRDIFVISEHN